MTSLTFRTRSTHFGAVGENVVSTWPWLLQKKFLIIAF